MIVIAGDAIRPPSYCARIRCTTIYQDLNLLSQLPEDAEQLTLDTPGDTECCVICNSSSGLRCRGLNLGAPKAWDLSSGHQLAVE